MKFVPLTGAGLLVLMAVATPTLAADIPVKAGPAPAPATVASFDWNGFYAGLNAGYGWGWGHATGGPGGVVNENNKHSGWLAGGQAGYNLQSGNWVWGAEIDGAWTNMENDADQIIVGRVIKDLITVRLRAGPAMGSTFYYATGGFASSKVEVINFDGNPDDDRLSRRQNGYAVGAGAEHALAPNWSAKLEYLYVDLGDRSYDVGLPRPRAGAFALHAADRIL